MRAHPVEAADIARRAGDLVSHALSSHALAEYATALLRGYAALDAEHRPEPPRVERGHHVRFVCELWGALECRFEEI